MTPCRLFKYVSKFWRLLLTSSSGWNCRRLGLLEYRWQNLQFVLKCVGLSLVYNSYFSHQFTWLGTITLAGIPATYEYFGVIFWQPQWDNIGRGLKNKRPTWCHLLFYFTSYVLNMFRTSIYPLSGAWDYSVELPHWSYCSWFDVCWNFGVVGLEWYPCCRLKPATKNNRTNVVIQQNSRKLLMMDILMPETCWAHKKWNKIASDIKFVFYSSTITMMHGPINVR